MSVRTTRGGVPVELNRGWSHVLKYRPDNYYGMNYSFNNLFSDLSYIAPPVALKVVRRSRLPPRDEHLAAQQLFMALAPFRSAISTGHLQLGITELLDHIDAMGPIKPLLSGELSLPAPRQPFTTAESDLTWSHSDAHWPHPSRSVCALDFAPVTPGPSLEPSASPVASSSVVLWQGDHASPSRCRSPHNYHVPPFDISSAIVPSGPVSASTALANSKTVALEFLARPFINGTQRFRWRPLNLDDLEIGPALAVQHATLARQRPSDSRHTESQRERGSASSIRRTLCRALYRCSVLHQDGHNDSDSHSEEQNRLFVGYLNTLPASERVGQLTVANLGHSFATIQLSIRRQKFLRHFLAAICVCCEIILRGWAAFMPAHKSGVKGVKKPSNTVSKVNVELNGRMHGIANTIVSECMIFSEDNIMSADCSISWPALRKASSVAPWMLDEAPALLPPEFYELERVCQTSLRLLVVHALVMENKEAFHMLLTQTATHIVSRGVALWEQLQARDSILAQTLFCTTKRKRYDSDEDSSSEHLMLLESARKRAATEAEVSGWIVTDSPDLSQQLFNATPAIPSRIWPPIYGPLAESETESVSGDVNDVDLEDYGSDSMDVEVLHATSGSTSPGLLVPSSTSSIVLQSTSPSLSSASEEADHSSQYGQEDALDAAGMEFVNTTIQRMANGELPVYDVPTYLDVLFTNELLRQVGLSDSQVDEFERTGQVSDPYRSEPFPAPQLLTRPASREPPSVFSAHDLEIHAQDATASDRSIANTATRSPSPSHSQTPTSTHSQSRSRFRSASPLTSGGPVIAGSESGGSATAPLVLSPARSIYPPAISSCSTPVSQGDGSALSPNLSSRDNDGMRDGGGDELFSHRSTPRLGSPFQLTPRRSVCSPIDYGKPPSSYEGSPSGHDERRCADAFTTSHADIQMSVSPRPHSQYASPERAASLDKSVDEDTQSILTPSVSDHDTNTTTPALRRSSRKVAAKPQTSGRASAHANSSRKRKKGSIARVQDPDMSDADDEMDVYVPSKTRGTLRPFWELPHNWHKNRERKRVNVLVGEDPVEIYGKNHRLEAAKLYQAGVRLSTESTQDVAILQCRIHPWDRPRTSRERRDITKVTREIKSNIDRGKVVVLRRPVERLLVEVGLSSDASSGDESDCQQRAVPLPGMREIIWNFVDPDTVVEVQVSDVHVPSSAESDDSDLDGPDQVADASDGDDVSTSSSSNARESLYSIDIQSFLEYGLHGRTGGQNVLSGTNTVPTVPTEWTRRLFFDITQSHNVTQRQIQPEVDMPQPQTCFTLFTHAGARSDTHIDASGFCTYVHIEAGEKIWVVKTLLEEPTGDFRDLSPSAFATTAFHLGQHDSLFMPPGTLHEVITTKDCIATGGHFLVDALVYETLITSLRLSGSYHTATNASHNGAAIFMFLKKVQRELQGVARHLEMFGSSASIISTNSSYIQRHPELCDFSHSDWMVGTLFAEYFFPVSKDDAWDQIDRLRDHQQVVQHLACLLVRLVDSEKPRLDPRDIIAKRVGQLTTIAQKTGKLRSPLDTHSARVALDTMLAL